MKKIKNIIKTAAGSEAVMYLFTGAMTTAVNFAVYYLLSKTAMSPTVCNAAAWAVSVIFAYFVNSRAVFGTKYSGIKTELKQFFEFVFARIFSAAVETACIFIFVEKLCFNDYAVKLAVTVLVILLNYVISKFVIFKKEKEAEEKGE